MNNTIREICRSCEHAEPKHAESCYCKHYGIIIGYSKKDCRGYKREQIQERKDRD